MGRGYIPAIPGNAVERQKQQADSFERQNRHHPPLSESYSPRELTPGGSRAGGGSSATRAEEAAGAAWTAAPASGAEIIGKNN